MKSAGRSFSSIAYSSEKNTCTPATRRCTTSMHSTECELSADVHSFGHSKSGFLWAMRILIQPVLSSLRHVPIELENQELGRIRDRGQLRSQKNQIYQELGDFDTLRL